MKRTANMFRFLTVIGLVGLLGGCGSGGEGASAGPASSSASGSAAASGTITGFGSVYVNGKKFDTNGSSFVVDGQSGSQGDLKLGMTVVVAGSINGAQRSASVIRQRDAVEGLVQSVAADGLSLVVLGQTVLVDDTTLVDNSIQGQNVLNLATGTHFVEVSGHIRPDGVIQATFIEEKTVGVTPEARGFVKGHDAATKIFKIGNLTVNYASALISDMPSPAGSNWNALFVEVKGTNFNAGTTTLTATKVEPESQGVQQADEFEVEGFVTQVIGLGDFFLGTTHVQTTANTEFRGGTIDEITVGAKLSAEGRLANGILMAKHVKFQANVKLEGNVVAVDLVAKTFTMMGLPGVAVSVNSQTEFKGNNGNAIVDLNDLSVGGHVRVRGRMGAGNSVIATRVEQRSADDEVDSQGPVQVVSNPNLTILGVAVNTSPLNNNDFLGLNEQPIGRAAFFNAVKVGTLVKMKGRLSGGVVIWREVELEDE